MEQMELKQSGGTEQGYPDGFTEKKSVRPTAILRMARSWRL